MAPFEALYGRRCRTPLNWSQTGERKIFGPDLIYEVEEKVKIYKQILRQHNLDRKATLIYEEAHYGFKSETSYIFEYLLLEVFKGSA
jgi:hypothetical protein